MGDYPISRIFHEILLRYCSLLQLSTISGADPGFQVRGGAHLRKLRRAEEGAKIFGVFRVKNHYSTPKNHIFVQLEREA